MERIFGYVRLLASGAPAPGATVHAYASQTLSHVPIYQDNNSPPTPLANPVTADSNGFFFFYTPNALIDLQFSGGGIPTPYALAAWAAGGIGDGGLLPVSSSSFPAVGTQHRGRLRLLGDSTLGPPGVWVQDQAAWQPALDYAFRSIARSALPAAPQAGMVRRLADGPQGLVIAHSGGWEPAMSFGFDSILKASLPTPGIRARLRQVTDSTRGLWVDQLAQWFSLTHEWIDAREFGAKGDGVSNDTVALQAAFDAVPAAGGVVILPPGHTYLTSAPLRLKDKTTLIAWGATIAPQAGSGDSCIRGVRRDDGTAATDSITILGLTISFTHTTTPYAVFDLTGLADSVFVGVKVIGAGQTTVSPAGQAAFRLSDVSLSGGSAAKSCFGNLVSGAFVQEIFTFLQAVQSSPDKLSANVFLQIHAEEINQGFNVSGVVSGELHLVCLGGRLVGTGGSTGSSQVVTSPAPPGLTFLAVRTSDFADGDGALPSSTFFKDDLSIGASGTSSTSPLSPLGTTPENFSGSAYVRVGAGTVIPAGVSVYEYTLLAAPAGATFLVSIVSGIPAASPLAFQAGLKAGTVTLSLQICSGAVITLASDLVLRVVQVGP